jgi:hypothetical protein
MEDNLFISNFNNQIIKKLIFNIILVIIIVFVLDFVIGKTLRYYYFKESSGAHFRTTYSMEETDANILVFGSSRASHHYIPEIFEDSLKMSFYNTGRDGNGIYFQAAILKSILKRYIPKIIIWDYSGDFKIGSDDYDRLSSLLPYFETHEEIRGIIELKSPFERIKLLSEIYAFNSQILTILIGNLDINKKRKSDNKGYIALNKEWQSEIDSVISKSEYEIDSNKIFAFNEFIKTAKKAGINIYVIYSPVYQKYNRSQEIDICKNICNYENIPFWNFSKDTLFLNNKHLFQDIVHLNNNGALFFSNLVVDKIKHNFVNK